MTFAELERWRQEVDRRETEAVARARTLGERFADVDLAGIPAEALRLLNHDQSVLRERANRTADKLLSAARSATSLAAMLDGRDNADAAKRQRERASELLRQAATVRNEVAP